MPWVMEESKEFDTWFDSLRQEDQEHIIAAHEYLTRIVQLRKPADAEGRRRAAGHRPCP